MDCYAVKKINKPVNLCVEVPGSKSITNRALLMAAMAEGESVLEGVLFSDDSNYFLKALEDLGFSLSVEKEKKTVKICGCGGKIPRKNAKVFVGSAGTAARFLTAFLAMSDGTYEVNATEQMKKRPMRELLEVLEFLGVRITYHEEPYTFPMTIEGLNQKTEQAEVFLNIDRSSQFLSALLMVSPLRFQNMTIHLTGSRSARSYVEMTEQMMKQFQHPGVQKLDENSYQVKAGRYQNRHYLIEPDVSAACYFYAMAAVTGGTAIVKRMRRDSLQGDMRFLDVLKKMGCNLNWKKFPNQEEEQLELTGPQDGMLRGFDLSFSDFSDQALTAAAIAPYANSPVTIRGIGHTRGQESNRIAVICTELGKLGIKTEEQEDCIRIYPGEVRGTKIETYEDHRVAMAFAVTGLRTDGLVIDNPLCCKKTFPEYFEVFDTIYD